MASVVSQLDTTVYMFVEVNRDLTKEPVITSSMCT